MRATGGRLFCFLTLMAAGAAPASPADSARGALLLRSENCLECHRVRGEGGSTAPDLGANLVPAYSPAALAARLWNHTPAMWNEMSARVVTRPTPTEGEWADVFAYLYTLRFVDRPGDAKRGAQVFQSRNCAFCHSLTQNPKGIGPAVAFWKPATDSVVLLSQMWNHAANMQREFLESRKQWKRLSGRDFMDLTAYIRSVQKVEAGETANELSLPDSDRGKALYSANCVSCHTGAMALETRLRNKTWMDIGAGMWNHVPLLPTISAVSTEDMRRILAWVWELQYHGEAGNALRGQQIFFDRRCVTCHPASPRPGKVFTEYSMIALGWGPGRQMHAAMQEKGIRWPYFDSRDIQDVVAYMNSLPTTRK